MFRNLRIFIASAILLTGIALSGITLFIEASMPIKLIVIGIFAVPTLLLFFALWPRVKPRLSTGHANTPYFDDSQPRGAFREYRIEYGDSNGEVTERDIYVLAIDANDPDLVKAWCFAKNDTRSFRSSRVISAMHVPSGRAVRNLAGDYQARH